MPTLVEALDRKYGQVVSTGVPADDLPVAIFVPRRSPRVSVPTLLVLNDCDIDSAGDPETLKDKCADIYELDLAKNKLTDWKEVFSILEQTKHVRFLNLSFNRLSAQLKSLESVQPRWDNLSNLVLNSTYVGWPSVHNLLSVLPALEELHLSLNGYTHVDLSGEERENAPCEECSRLREKDRETPLVHRSLRKLHFSGNPVRSWREVAKLGRTFPALEALLLNDCPIGTLAPDPCGSCTTADGDAPPHHAFPHLRFLNLNNSGLGTWDEVDRLARFPALTSLRVQGWALWEALECTEHERRMLLVARLPRVRTLNGGAPLAGDERDAAERAFIRYYMDRPEADRPDRYWELVGVHGKLDPLVSVDLRPEKRVRVTLVCGAVAEPRTLDVYRTVGDLKSRLERFAGFPASKMRLFYVDQDLRDSQGPEEMKYPTKRLYSYNIRSGDEIIVDSKY